MKSENFTVEKIPIAVSKSMEAAWCLIKPKQQVSRFKIIVVYSFHSPPDYSKIMNAKLADYLVTTLHYLSFQCPVVG